MAQIDFQKPEASGSRIPLEEYRLDYILGLPSRTGRARLNSRRGEHV